MHGFSLRRFSLGLAAIGSLVLAAGSALAAAPTLAPVATPPASINVGQYYYLRVQGKDADGDALYYSVQNLPSWIEFNKWFGTLRGTAKVAGTYSNIIISVTDGKSRTYLAPITIRVVGGTTTSGGTTSNAAPTISGTPATSAALGQAYNFVPTASDANQDKLTFSIGSKPSWAAFNTTTGQLSGTASTAGTYSNIVISVSDGKASRSLAAFNIVVAVAGNSAPTIAGTPVTAINAGTAYSFKPTASDADKNTLAFSIANKPSWAAFNTSTGLLSGTPSAAQAGSYSNIIMSVSDGKANASLKAFAIAVTQSSNGSATLSWTPPTANTDGSTLVNLAGYKIYYGTSAAAMNQTIALNGTGLTSYVVSNLSPATYYFAISAINSGGLESDLSGVAAKTVN